MKLYPDRRCLDRWRAFLLPLATLLVASATLAAVDAVADEPAPEAEAPFQLDHQPELLRIDVPEPGQRLRLTIPYLEVRGRTGAAELYDADVVVAIDVSQTVLFASGVDVDGDGTLGVTHDWARDKRRLQRLRRHHMRWTSDPDDTVLEAEKLAAAAIVKGLAQRKNRVGVLSYTEVARPRAYVGAPEVALASIETIRPPTRSRASDVARALDSAARMLRGLSQGRDRLRQRAILLFTDGGPLGTPPPKAENFALSGAGVLLAPQTLVRPAYWATRAAFDSARRLVEDDISLYVFSFGHLGPRAEPFLIDLAQAARAPLIPVERPRALLGDLPSVDLQPRRFEIHNLTNRSEARAVRTSRDGWFDGFVTLSPGANEILVKATLIDGSVVSERRIVHYQKPAAPTEEDRRRSAAMLVDLRARGAEVERFDGPPRAPQVKGAGDDQ